jgi:hypothetical protein
LFSDISSDDRFEIDLTITLHYQIPFSVLVIFHLNVSSYKHCWVDYNQNNKVTNNINAASDRRHIVNEVITLFDFGILDMA